MDISLNYAPSLRGTAGYGDLMIVNGDLALTADAPNAASSATDPIAQSCVQKMRTLLGEYFLNTSLGVPYFQELLGQKARSSEFEKALQNVILATPGVIALASWAATTQPRTRTIVISFRAQTTTGVVSWSGSIGLS